VIVDPVKARFSAWYEMFPRSARGDGRHATFKDVVERLPYVQEMGFDVLYFPPIHPIGTTARKGKNNAVAAERARSQPLGDRLEGGRPQGRPAGVGHARGFPPPCFRSEEQKHRCRAGHRLPVLARPPVRQEHPEWFRWRPDGTVQYAENPPKKYQDIYPFEFETAAWRACGTS
jgi:starch synthase (maltosyl-transferring)